MLKLVYLKRIDSQERDEIVKAMKARSSQKADFEKGKLD